MFGLGDLTNAQKIAIVKAHNAQSIPQKAKILKAAGFDRVGRGILLENQVCGRDVAEADWLEGIHDDAEQRAVFADWLEERGDIRAEYIRLTAQAGREKNWGELGRINERLRTIQKEVDAAWGIPLSATGVTLDYVEGVPKGATILNFEGLSPHHTDRLPLKVLTLGGTAENLWKMADRPALSSVKYLKISPAPATAAFDDQAKKFFASPQLQNLTSLELDSYQGLPEAVVAKANFTKLEHFEVRWPAQHGQRGWIRELGNSRLRNLRSLTLADDDGTLDDFNFDTPAFTSLEELNLNLPRGSASGLVKNPALSFVKQLRLPGHAAASADKTPLGFEHLWSLKYLNFAYRTNSYHPEDALPAVGPYFDYRGHGIYEFRPPLRP